MAKKRITQITVERTAFLTTDYFGIDSATGTNNTAKLSGPNLLAQLRDGPTSPTFQVSLSTLATAGLGGVSRLARGFDIFGSNPKATTAAVQNLFQVASNDAASPLALRLGIKTDATGGSRYGSIEVDDAGTKRPLILQPTGGLLGVGRTDPARLLDFKASNTPFMAFFEGDRALMGTGFSVSNTDTTGSAFISLNETASSVDSTPAYITRYGSTHATKANKVELVNAAAASMGFLVNGSERIHITSAGLIGIGKTPAAEKLEVEGNIQILNGGYLKGSVYAASKLTIDNDVTIGSNRDIYMSPTGATSALIVKGTTGNIGIGQTTFGAGAVKVMAFGNGTIPGTIADGFQLVSADIVPGNAAPHFVTEAGPVIRLYQQAHIPDADGSLGSVNSQLNLLLAAVRNTRLLAAA